ncbi:MAG: quinone-dependent dihydroorotate dehydrogenase [Cytophagales bacterium]|nr:quinone-dependent dihydroorotate dehydrogenase [Cytophagales bacterium]MDW8383750.1 quinone-dependent dihydroorotate dehydrogenase [Flammeovirgaceae bacterium]
MCLYSSALRSLLFCLEPETSHSIALQSLKWSTSIPFLKKAIQKRYTFSHIGLERKLWGITFVNPIGLAAGFDKNASYIDELACLGFGFIEIGTVTPRPQEGNPPPRLFRLAEDYALVNRMGFNNDGVDAVAKRLQKRKSSIVIGGNIGKNKSTPNEYASQDYLTCFEKLFDHVDYFAINVSSPNTPQLRQLQDKEPLTRLLSTLQEANQKKTRSKPLLLKIAPDITSEQLEEIAEIVIQTQFNGVIATNTTISRENLKTSKSRIESIGSGGLSGKPLTAKSTDVIRLLEQKSCGKFDIVGVGGIFSPEDAREKIRAGAKLIQLYTGFVYQGPSLPSSIARNLI